MQLRNLLTIAAVTVAAVAAHGAPPIRAVVITGDHPFTLDTFLAAFEGHDGVEFTHAPQQNHEEIFDNVQDWPYDVMVFYHFSMEIPPHRLQNLLALLEQGVGLVLMHHGGMTYWNVEELRDVYGIRWNPPDFVFYLDQDYTAHIADPDHPILHGLRDFQVHDETYTNFQTDDYPGNHTLITADHPNSDRVIAWTRYYGDTRVAGFQLGHDTPVFSHPAFKTIIGRMAQWAAGRLPDETGGPVLTDTTIYRENRQTWLDRQILESPAGAPQLAHDEIRRRVLAAHNDPVARKALAQRLAGLLKREGTADGKRFLLRQLAFLRAPEASGEMAALLDDPDLGQTARGVLEDCPGDDVSDALVTALATSQGEGRAGIINTLARRCGPGVVEVLAGELVSQDGAAVSAALDALGWLGTGEAAKVLLDRLNAGHADACAPLLVCGRTALANGLVPETAAIMEAVKPHRASLSAALRRGYYLLELQLEPAEAVAMAAMFSEDPDPEARLAAYQTLVTSGPDAVSVLTDALLGAAAEEQVIILASLRSLGDAHAAETLRAAADAEHEAVRIEAIRALAVLGDTKDVPRLFEAALRGTEREGKAARAALTRLPDVDEALAARAPSPAAAETVLALNLLAARQAVAQSEAVYKLLGAPEATVRAQAWVSAGHLTAPDDLAKLQARVVDETNAAEALARVARKADDLDAATDALCDYPYINDTAHALALAAVAQLATPHALERLTEALSSDSLPVREAALRALMAWPTPAPATSLLNYARSTSNAPLREEALRACIAQTELDGALAPGDAVARLQEAYAMAHETVTKERALEAAGKSAHIDGLVLLRAAVEEAPLRKAAMRATLRLATFLAADHPDESLAALRHVVESAEDEGFRVEALATLEDVTEYRGRLLAHWSFSHSPEGWRAENDCAIRVEDGLLHINTTGEDPHIVTETHVPAGQVEIVMRAQFDVLGVGQFFWVYDDQPGYGLDSPFAVFELMQQEEGWADFRIPIRFERPITSLRLDPGMEMDGKVLIDYIRVERAE